MDMLLRAKDFTVKSATGAKDLALNAKDIHKDLFVFQKTLRDMIKGMRNMRDQEERYVAEALQVAPLSHPLTPRIDFNSLQRS